VHKLVGTSPDQGLGPAPNYAAAHSASDDTITLPEGVRRYQRWNGHGLGIPEQFREITELLQQPVKTQEDEFEQVELPKVRKGHTSLNEYEKVSPGLIRRIDLMQSDIDYQETIDQRNYLRPYPVLQKGDEDAKEWFNSDSIKLMKLNSRNCPRGVVGYTIPPTFDYMNVGPVVDKITGQEFGAAAYTVYFKGYYSTVKEHTLFKKVLVRYGLKTGEILCTSFDRKENGELTGTGYIKFRNSIVARLAIYEMGETDDPRNSGWAMNCGNSQCRVYMQPSNREMVLPLYPWCSLDASPDLRNLRFPGAQWLPVGTRGIDHPRMYSELNGLVICDEFSDELIDDHGTGTQDSWLTVAGIDHHIENRTICHNCGAEGHIVSHCHLEANQLAREQALAERRRQSAEAQVSDS